MAILEVLKFPNPKLREVSKQISKFDDATLTRIGKLAEDLFETMYSENGIGLAAPQVGELTQMVIVDARPRDTEGRYKMEEMTELEQTVKQPLVILNPKILKYEGKTTFDEGCLSVPMFYETVERHKYIELEYHDINGKKCHLKTDGLLAIVIQHELDHLEGTLFIDHLSLIKSNKIKNEIKKHGYPKKKRADEEEDVEL